MSCVRGTPQRPRLGINKIEPRHDPAAKEIADPALDDANELCPFRPRSRLAPMRGWWRDHFCLVAVIFGAAAARVALFCVAPHVETPDTTAYIESGTTLFATGRMSSSVYMPLY